MHKIIKILTILKGINYSNIAKELLFFSRFFILVLIYLFFDLFRIGWKIIKRIPFINKAVVIFKKPTLFVYKKLSDIFNSRSEGEISSLDLITLAVRHLKAKKNRTIITIGGMSIGFGSVIFLLSLGYGAQRLVVSRVARLSEMKQADVTIGQAASLRINDKTIDEFSKIEGVDSVLPLVSVVTKVEYNNSVSDAVAYGVNKKFLEESAIQPSRGEIFNDGEITSTMSMNQGGGEVAGAQDIRISGVKMNKQFSQVKYSIYPIIWKPVYSQPSSKSEILGYTRRETGEQDALEVWGEKYKSNTELPTGIDFFGNEYVPWVEDDFPLWKKEACDIKNLDCVDGEYKILKNGLIQQIKTGFISEEQLVVDRYKIISSSGLVVAENEVIDNVQFSISSAEYISVFSEADQNKELLNLVTTQQKSEELIKGELIFGSSYQDKNNWGSITKNKNGKQLGLWIRAKLPMWRKLDCNDCNNLYLKEVDNFDNQVISYAYIKANAVKIEEMVSPPIFGQVLGEATSSAELATESAVLEISSPISASLSAEPEEDLAEIALSDGTTISAVKLEDGTLDWVTMASDSGNVSSGGRDIISFPEKTQKVALVNRALLNVLGLQESEAIDKNINVVLKLDAEFFDRDYQAETQSTVIKIIGVIPEDKTPAFYMPFSDIKSLGIDNYSQIKIIVKDQNNLKEVRKNIETLGFRTSSVTDTVSRINSLFGTVRILLSTLGLVALSIAALGMFNTLTVSLLEKTREVGLMKAIGMQSNEVKRLFLAESIIMGLSGGIFGLILGVVSGHALSISLSTISLTKGLGYINLVYVPAYLAFGILTLSFMVGVLTGLYPSHRATKISALNALRYE